MAFRLPDLPYSRDALGEYMSAETLEFHHGKHHKAYVDKTNGMLGEKGLEGASLSQVIRTAREKGDGPLFNNSAQIWNHSFYWQCLAPPEGQRPTGRLAELIDEGFGGTDALLAKLKQEAVGHFSNGWVWLADKGGTLSIEETHDGDTLADQDMVPLLTIDLWEHAYYLDHQNLRPDYLKQVIDGHLNWGFAAENLARGSAWTYPG